MSSFRENVKTRRLELGLSQRQLADKLGYLSRSSIAHIEAGRKNVLQSDIQNFAKALDTTVAALMGWDHTSDENATGLTAGSKERKNDPAAIEKQPELSEREKLIIKIAEDLEKMDSEKLLALKRFLEILT